MTEVEQINRYLSQPYSRVLIPDETGGYFGEILEFPGCFTQGATPQEALRNLDEAMTGWIETALDNGQQIPPPLETAGYSGRILLRLPKSIHKAAARRAEMEGVSLNHYLVTSIAAHLQGDDLADRIANRLSMTRAVQVAQITMIKFTATTEVQERTMRPLSVPELQEGISATYEPMTTFQRKERQNA